MSTSKDPFPSPGSSFIPPPVPGPHEFATPISRKMSKKDLDDVRTSTLSPNGVSPNGVDPPPPDPLRDPPDPLPLPTPQFDPQLSLPYSSHNRLSTQSVTSLTSSRPAPPSPAVSRRASGLSRASSRPVSDMSIPIFSRPASGIHTASRPTSGTVQATASLAVITTTTRHPLPNLAPTTAVPIATTSATTTTPTLIQIRDYGFEPADPRFTGQGPLVPRANRPAVLARRLAGSSGSTPTSSNAADDADDADEWEDDEGDRDRMSIDVVQTMWENMMDNGTNGWSGFKWGFGRGWGFGPDSGVGTGAASSAAGFPSRGDFDRNFGGEDDDIEMDEEGEAFSEGEADAEGDPPLFPGLYRALYSFEPEGTAEMKLDEDQLVRVIGRGGGVGWAVVVKDGLRDAGVHALVPESYLEVVRLDSEDSEC